MLADVTQLKLAWHLDLPSRRGLEATPLVVDGRMYTTGTWSRVYALDAATVEHPIAWNGGVLAANCYGNTTRRYHPGKALTPVATW